MQFFDGFDTRDVDVNGKTMHVRIGGEGKPLLLLHGYPQTGATWSRVASSFARHFKCIIPDLPGYGLSHVPEDMADHGGMSKRSMSGMMVEVMRRLGHASFAVLGHDRGARVAYRMALDHPASVTRLGIIEVIPTSDMWANFDAGMAIKAYHWPFLAQPFPLPETLIGHDPVFYIDWTLRTWSKLRSLDAFDRQALAEYRRQARDPARIHAMCEDYRAGAGMDREIDEADRKAGRRIAAPLHFVWSPDGFPARSGDPVGLWREWADTVTGNPVDAGHFAQEEKPKAVIESFVPFFL